MSVVGFDVGGRHHHPRKGGGLWELGKAMKCILLQSLWKEHSPANT